MASITKPLVWETTQIRPLNVMRDLPSVANLVETCFSETLDADGHQFIHQMRKAAKDNRFLQWAVRTVDNSSLPLTGFVWEESGAIVGNISVIPHRQKNQKIYLIANVAVHPDFRRRRIGKQLTEAALHYARKRRASEIWLQVRDDNPAAIHLYQEFGFQEVARRTRWQACTDNKLPSQTSKYSINNRRSKEWILQKRWLERSYPENLAWYQPIDWLRFRPGVLPSIYRFFSESESHHWTISDTTGLLAMVTWFAELNRVEKIWVAAPEGGEALGLTELLLHARKKISSRKNLILDYPGGEAVDAIANAGFTAVRTLIWMKMDTTSELNMRK